MTVINAMQTAWNTRIGYPSIGFWADNGGEFRNKEMEEFGSKKGFTVKFGPSYSPLSNGMNERNHYSADFVVRKIMDQDDKMTLEEAVNLASWTHNTNVNRFGYDPMTLVTGKSVTFPGISNGNVATESLYDSEGVKKLMERHHEMTKAFREIEFESKLIQATKIKKRGFKDQMYKEGDKVYYQEQDKLAWKGPVRVLYHRGRDVMVQANGGMRKVAS